jgi:predicted nucleotidyltransferase
MGRGSTTEQDDPETFSRVLGDAARALADAGMPYLVFGSLAVSTYGKEMASEDVDILIRPTDERRALHALAAAGFETDETDQTWLSKAVRDGVLVDLMVQLSGDLFLDDEMLERARRTDIRGVPVALISPEDQLLVAAATNTPETENQWYDAISILMRTRLDWPYLLERSRVAPRRVLALLIYAESDDIEVPRDAIDDLFARIYAGRSSGSIAISR